MRLLYGPRCFSLAATFCLGLLAASSASAAGDSVLTGTVRDAETREPLADVVIIVTSPAIQGELVAVTDAFGTYRVSGLSPGEYTIRIERDGHRPSSRGGITLQTGTTSRANVLLTELSPDELGPDIALPEPPPSVDIRSTTTGLIIESDVSHRLPVAPPGGRASALRSFESLGALVPGAQPTSLGFSIHGSSAPENRFEIDGVSVGSASDGINDTPLSLAFVRKVHIATGGYLPEFGRTTGGVFDVVTKSGGNAFHGSIFGSVAPGAFEGERKPVRAEGTVVAVDQKLGAMRDFGFELGGPIKEDRLWFYAGLNVAFEDLDIARSLHRLRYETNPDGSVKLDASGHPIGLRDEYGVQRTEPIEGGIRRYVASKETLQYIGKLTWYIPPRQDSSSHTLTLSVFGSPTWSGGDGRISLDGVTGTTNTSTLEGHYAAFGRREEQRNHTASLTLSSAFLHKRLLLDATIAYHHASSSRLPVDGAAIGSGKGLDAVPGIAWTRGAPHTLADFEDLPAGSGCEPKGSTNVIHCPVRAYLTGGPGNVNESITNRFQGKAVVTYLLQALGFHVIKAGLDVEVSNSLFAQANTGNVWFSETRDGSAWQVFRIGNLTGPDDVYVPKWQSPTTHSTLVGGFVQDSFHILDRVLVNAGLRYDAQMMSSSEGMGMVLPNQWSPRVGVIYDVTRRDRSKLFVNYARHYENVPLGLADALFVRRPLAVSEVSSSVCDPSDPAKVAACLDPKNNLTIGQPYAPNRQWGSYHGNRAPVDPEIEAQSMDEIAAGGEYEVFDDARVGVNYVHRSIHRAIETMSRDEGTSIFVGNPGHGAASDVPEARRDYDAVTVFFQKSFAWGWFALASYTASYLRGNYPGLASGPYPSPHTLSDFDLLSLQPNRDGPLPGDRRHSVKVFGAKEFVLAKKVHINLGMGYTGTSGAPLDVLGAHPTYGRGAVFLLPRGAGGNLPWVHSVDSTLAVGYKVGKDSTLSVSVDVFNLFNFQAETSRNQSFTYAIVRPIDGGTAADLPNKGEAACATGAGCRYKLVNFEDGSPFDPADRNPSYGSPTSYQSPRTIRMGMRLTF
ncbi:TonB-dependent receptor domain-containing protein [Polyangium mundeleinium]|uniref:TonB-dependent receptor n=1 Tax=Polyangium mundeleinium TaxID=2995306 RepID=A0ABT5EUI5_9BACT|nr:TonB-dependent receptor [Polyangium mundeleinium]MDC0745019.1 TonB-dependent receptor [Polyangium mundeleinium]